MVKGHQDWIGHQVMKGLYGTTFVPIAVDEDGNIIGILKGEYAGTLKTLATDELGRMLAVLTDPEDVFGNPNYIGAGELAARLGSIKRYDKRGEIMFMDDFEDSTLHVDLGGVGTGNSAARSTNYARSGNYSVKLVTGDTTGNSAYIWTYHPYPIMAKLGGEFSFSVMVGLYLLGAHLLVYDGTTLHRASLYYNEDSGVWSILLPSGASQTIISDVQPLAQEKMWHTVKLVADFDTETYVRVMVDNREVDLSSYGLYQAGNGTQPHFEFNVVVETLENEQKTMYVDDVIVTQNEP